MIYNDIVMQIRPQHNNLSLEIELLGVNADGFGETIEVLSFESETVLRNASVSVSLPELIIGKED